MPHEPNIRCNWNRIWNNRTLVASLYGVLDCFCTARDMLVTGPSVMVMLLTSCSVVAFIVSIRLIISFRSILRRSVKNNELSNCSAWFWMNSFLEKLTSLNCRLCFWWQRYDRLVVISSLLAVIRWRTLGVLLLRSIFCQCFECTISIHHRRQPPH